MAADTTKQHRIYMAIVAFVNGLFIINGILFPLRILNIIIVGLPHFRDLAYIFMRMIFSSCKFVKFTTTELKECDAKRMKNVIAVIPAYKEDPEEVELTLNSIGTQMEDDMPIGMVIVSDGFLDYHEILDDLTEKMSFEYTTYKKEPNKCTVLLGYYKGMKVVVCKKKTNAGKKDSLIVMDDVLIKNEPHWVEIRTVLLDCFGMDTCEFMFHTDADSVIGPNVFRRQVTALLSNDKIAGVAGLVLVPFEGFRKAGFWNLFQGFQYFYGQVIRKATDSLWGKTTCLPGCITMMRTHHPAVVAACDRYNKLPSSDFVFQVKNRLQGTDRRYTNCVLQHSLETYLVVDMEADCFTIPPQSMEHFRSQRKRWTSNAITGNFFLMCGSNVPFYTRMLCSIDIFRIHTSLTRFACTIQFFNALIAGDAKITNFQISMLVLVLVLPYVFFLSTIVGRGRYGRFLFVGSLVSKVCSPFVTIYIFVYAMYYFNDLNWGKTHGSQPTEEKEESEDGEEKDENDEENPKSEEGADKLEGGREASLSEPLLTDYSAPGLERLSSFSSSSSHSDCDLDEGFDDNPDTYYNTIMPAL